ncbi:agmatinase [Candidatus Micrarchaeota archaeon]|nr:agmatinase [Candidatus Micrarchaeota archaeon]
MQLKFIESDVGFQQAKVVFLPVPYDLTSSFISGAREGPYAILRASIENEDYDMETGKTPSSLGFHVLDPVPVDVSSPENMIKEVEKNVSYILENNKFPVILGGEHTVTLGALNAFPEKDFSILQIDAHADMRDSYMGSRFSHVCVMRRASESFDNIVQAGVRSISQEEADYLKTRENIFTFGSSFNIEEVISSLKNEKVYLTIDLDGIDPSQAPAVGTPQPGGIFYSQLLELLKELSKSKKIIGMDVVELAPIPGNRITEMLAASLIYKSLAYFL